MLRNYFTVAFRNIARNKAASFINIFGLAAGIASCLLIFFFVRNETSYDTQNPNKERIFRVASEMTLTGQTDHLALSSFLLGPTLKKDYPEVEHAIRVMPIYKQTIWYDSRVFQLENVFFSDSDFFTVFPYRFIEGSSNTALNEPYSIVLTEESAQLFFGTATNVLGKMLKFARASYKVTGVVEAPKNESHLNFSAMISISSLPKDYAGLLKMDWFRMAQANYVMFKQQGQADNFQPKLNKIEDNYIAPFLKANNTTGKLHFTLQPLTDIHLGQKGNHFDYADIGNASYIYIFSVVAVFILLIACINYVNMATAKSAHRAKEVGIRKTAGADRAQLIRQFIGESVFITMLSVVLALCLAELLLPFFNRLTDKSLHLNLGDPGVLLFIVSIIIFVGVVSGLYPAVYLSKFQPVQVLKSNNIPKSGNVLFRKVLVVLQFGISIVLIIGTMLVFMQMHFIKNKDVGFDKDHIYVLRAPGADSSFVKKYDELKHELESNPSVLKVAASSQIPGLETGAILQYTDYGQKHEERLMNMMTVDYNFLSLMNIPLVKGRNFSKGFASDDTGAFIINETAARQFNWNKPLEVSMLNALGHNGKVVGVVRDFNYTSLQKPIEPLVIMPAIQIPGFVLVKMKAENLPATISFVESKWKMFSKKYPLDAFFLDENFDKQYRAEDKMLTVFACFTVLTILIACLGLLALASYTAEQRTKEIGIRKVMGASAGSIVALLSKDFMKLVIIALVLAAPVAWYAMHRWLQDFAYRIEISAWIIFAGGILALCVAMLTVSYQAIRAAWQNPVDAIKYE